MALTDKLTAIGDAVRGKAGTTEPMTLDEMATAIQELPAVPVEILHWTGNQEFRNYNGSWDKFIETYGSQITTENITDFSSAFSNSKLVSVPFELNCSNTVSYDTGDLYRMFYNCQKLAQCPKINMTPAIQDFRDMFYNCVNLKSIDLNFDNVDFSRIWDKSGGIVFFTGCSSIRKLPMNFFINLKKYSTASTDAGYSYKNLDDLTNLDEIINLPIYSEEIYTTNCFPSMYLRRLKNFTFETQEDGSPYAVNWSNQCLDLSNCGYCQGYQNAPQDGAYILYNTGITTDKRIYDDETYQTLKNDPDSYVYFTYWGGGNIHYYSRYDKVSAIRTINSLPDVSASGGTNTIKFKGEAGLKTDGGAINTMTEEEIAVATSKGWTVSFV